MNGHKKWGTSPLSHDEKFAAQLEAEYGVGEANPFAGLSEDDRKIASEVAKRIEHFAKKKVIPKITTDPELAEFLGRYLNVEITPPHDALDAPAKAGTVMVQIGISMRAPMPPESDPEKPRSAEYKALEEALGRALPAPFSDKHLAYQDAINNFQRELPKAIAFNSRMQCRITDHGRMQFPSLNALVNTANRMTRDMGPIDTQQARG